MMAPLESNDTTFASEMKFQIWILVGKWKSGKIVRKRHSQPQAHQLKDDKATPDPGSNKQERGLVKVGRKARGKREREKGVKGKEGGQERF